MLSNAGPIETFLKASIFIATAILPQKGIGKVGYVIHKTVPRSIGHSGRLNQLRLERARKSYHYPDSRLE
jgi:hypothetical protein